ncbi:MAG: hypothetical protein ACOYXT_07585 [Bacteroidota bacterium]
MTEIKGLLDSIDESRNVLRVQMHEGTSFEDFTSRLTDINQYVKRSVEKILNLENALKTSETESEAYVMMVAALKDELTIRTDEIDGLMEKVEKYQAENKNLVKTVQLQESEMADMHTTIQIKQQELNLFNAKIDELAEKFKMSEAEAFYTRGQAVEEAAKRTKLAPRKKRETLKEALELYKRAYSLGKQEAKVRIDALEGRI